MIDDDAVVDLRDVQYAIETREIFNGLNLRVRRGSITAVMGPSGTGKTTLRRLIMGQILARRGQVRVFGQQVASLDRRALYKLPGSVPGSARGISSSSSSRKTSAGSAPGRIGMRSWDESAR